MEHLKNIHTAVILCGGKSTRMGFDKQRIKVNGNYIVLHIADMLSLLFDDVIIVSNTPELYSSSGYKVVSDIITGCGPMGGMYTGLLNCVGDYAYVTAGDMPFVCPEFIRFLDKNLSSSYPLPDAVTVIRNNRTEPFNAVYSKNTKEIIKKLLFFGEFKMSRITESVDTLYIQDESFKECDKHELMFMNINTKGDLSSVAHLNSEVFFTI